MGYTYSGHPVACAVALENLALIEREGLLARATAVGDHLFGALSSALAGLPHVGEVRHAGRGFGIELVTDTGSRQPLPMGPRDVSDVIRDETGVIVRTPSPHVVVLSPPLVLGTDEADRVAQAVASVLRRLRPDGTLAAG